MLPVTLTVSVQNSGHGSDESIGSAAAIISPHGEAYHAIPAVNNKVAGPRKHNSHAMVG